MIELLKRLKKHLASHFILFTLCLVLFGFSDVQAASHNSGIFIDSFLSAILAFTSVIIIIIATAKLVKFLNRSTGSFFKSDHIQVIESVPLSATLRIHLIRVKETIYVIAENAHSIEIITSFDGADISFFHKQEAPFQEILKNKWSEFHRKK